MKRSNAFPDPYTDQDTSKALGGTEKLRGVLVELPQGVDDIRHRAGGRGLEVFLQGQMTSAKRSTLAGEIENSRRYGVGVFLGNIVVRTGND